MLIGLTSTKLVDIKCFVLYNVNQIKVGSKS